MNIKYKILLVDDEQPVLKILQKALSDISDEYELYFALSGKEALEILTEEDIFIVVSDIFMKEMSGLQLLAAMREKYPYIDVILMSGYPTEKINEELKHSGCLQFLEKPFQIEQLNKLIRNQIEKRDGGFAGTLKNIQLDDLIQMCCLAESSMTIRVSKGAEQGIIYISEGELVHSICGKVAGEEAFYKMLGWGNGKFETIENDTTIERTIEIGFQSLLMEAARRVDEGDVAEIAAESVSEALEQLQNGNPLRVVIVDDSQMMCKIISDILTTDEGIEIVGIANNGEEALKKIDELKPDIITLDVNMPVMDGSTALKHIMIRSPCPVVIISSISSRSWLNILDFLCLGAVDFINKPSGKDKTADQRDQIISTIRHAACAEINNFQRTKMQVILNSGGIKMDSQQPCEVFVVICSGAGGYAELIKVLPNISMDDKTCVMSLLPMSDEFVYPFADYLDKRSIYNIFPLKTGSQLFGGTCYIGSVHSPLALNRSEGDPGFNVQINSASDFEEIQSGEVVEHFLNTISDLYPGKVIVVLLSGSEMSGTDCLAKIKETNGVIISQKLDTCMVPQNLRRVVQSNLVDFEKAPLEIAGKINEYKYAE